MVNIEAARQALEVLERARAAAVKHRDLMRNSKDPMDFSGGVGSDPMLDTLIRGIDDRIRQILPKITATILGEILESANRGVQIANEAGIARMPQICIRSGPPS